MKVSIQQFLGRIWRTHTRYLQDGQASEAFNCDLRNQSLRPLRAPSLLGVDLGDAMNVIYRWGQGEPDDTRYWFAAQGFYNFVRGQVANDDREWTYATLINHETGEPDDWPYATFDDLALHGSHPSVGAHEAQPTGLEFPKATVPLGVRAPTVAVQVEAQEYVPEGTPATLVVTAEMLAAYDYSTPVYGSIDEGATWHEIPLTDSGNTAQDLVDGLSGYLSAVTAEIIGGEVHISTVETGADASAWLRLGGASESVDTFHAYGRAGDSGASEPARVTIQVPTFSQNGDTAWISYQINDGPIHEIWSRRGLPGQDASAVRSIIDNVLSLRGLNGELRTTNNSGYEITLETVAAGADVQLTMWVFFYPNGASRQPSIYTDDGANGDATEGLPAHMIAGPDILRRLSTEVPIEVSADGSSWYDLPLPAATAAGLAQAVNGEDWVWAEVRDDAVHIFTYAKGPEAQIHAKVPTAGSAGAIIKASGGVKEPGEKETRVYIWTRVKKFMEGDEPFMEWESAPAPPSEPVDVYADQSVRLFGVADDDPPFNFTHVRVYRSVAGEYLFLTEAEQGEAGGTLEFIDDLSADDLGEVCPSMEWDLPPEHMRGLTGLPNGVMAGFVNRDVFLCEPYRPHAWPRKYQYTVSADIVGLGAMDTTLAVLTKAHPYFLQGSHPGAMVVVRADLEQACVSRASIVEMQGAVVYASPDGLVRLSPGGSGVVTKDIIGRYDWRALNPETMRSHYHDRVYVGITDTDMILMDFDNGQMSKVDPQLGGGLPFRGGYTELRSDALYLCREDGQIVEWQGSDTDVMTYTWQSKVFTMPRHTGFSAIEVDAEDYTDLRLTVYASTPDAHGADEPLTPLPGFDARPVTSRLPMRLPVRPARDWQIKLEGTNEVFAINMAQSMEELANV